MKIISYEKVLILLLILLSTNYGRAAAENLDNGPTQNQILKEWLSTLLGLPNTTMESGDGAADGRTRAHGGRIHTPEYVQSLYDRIASEAENNYRSIGYQRSFFDGTPYNFGPGSANRKANHDPLTIQAVARESQHTSYADGYGYVLKFKLKDLWISKPEVQLVELVLAVDFNRLVAPPNSYTVITYSVDENDGTGFSRLLVSAGSLGILESFRENFVKINVTDTVIRKMSAGQQSIAFEIFVMYKNHSVDEDGRRTETRRDLTHQEVGRLMHLSSHGVHQPLLVLYSLAAKKIGTQTGPIPQTRRRRSVVNSTPQNVRNWRHPDEECQRHEWWINLAELFQDSIFIKPDGFYAYFCAGACHHPMYHSRWNATGNAYLRSAYNVQWRQQQEQNGSNKPSDVPEPTCVAQSVSPITVVYKVQQNFIIQELARMVVNSCMCA